MSKREKEIRIKVSEDEYEDILQSAEKLNMQVAPYVRMVAQNPTIIRIDYSPVEAHTKEIAKIRNSINSLVFTIDASNNYLPREIETIVNLMNKLFETENQLLKTMRTPRYIKVETKTIDLSEEEDGTQK